MPIDPEWFKLIPEFVLNAPRFMRRLVNNEYDNWIENALWGIDGAVALPPLPRELGTFSDDISDSASRVTDYLRYIAVHLHPTEYDFNNFNRFIINVYSQNSMPFHAITRGMTPLRSYEDMTPEIVEQFFSTVQVGQQTVEQLNTVLRSLPVLSPSEYDVSWWTQGYSGQMVFRGALTMPYHSNDTGSHGAIYNFNGELTGENIINLNDVVVNTDFMSTSAHPSVAAEFVMRQALPWPGAHADIPAIITDAIYRRVFFRIEMRSGRNVCPWTALQQAEILFPTRSLFYVREITVGDYGLLIYLVELTEQEAAATHSARNIFTGANLDL